MILKSVRVQNFKCIDDSGEFSIDDVTCLVGKNESGKTTVLKALYKLNADVPEEGVFDDLLEYPRRKWSEYKERCKENPDNVLTTVWELEPGDMAALGKRLGNRAVKSGTVEVEKGYGNEQYWDVEIDEARVVGHYVSLAELSEEEIAELKGLGTIGEVVRTLQGSTSESERKAKLLSRLEELFPEGDVVASAVEVLEERLPTFVYFADYDRLRGEVAIDELLKKVKESRLASSDRVFMALLGLVGVRPEDINSMGQFEGLVAELEGISNRLSREIFAYWSQNRDLEVDFRFDSARPKDAAPLNSGHIFRTRIRNRRHGVTVGFDERSSGFVWFFSFLIWFSQAKRNYGDNLVILLDDPGLSLHARAQGDLLRYINEKLRPQYQVIYTTHSPFMVDPDSLLRVRTVEDVVVDEEVQGTKVGDKVLSTDADTVFPLQAALGYDITQTLFVGKHILLVEGPSDLMYLKWFSVQLGERGRKRLDRRWVITPCGGVSKIGSFLSLFRATELHVAVFTDFHADQKGKVRSLRESELLKAGHVYSAEMYVGQAEADIEDMLGRSLYVGLVNGCYSLDEGQRLPEARFGGGAVRVLKEVEEHFAVLQAEAPEFDHLVPAVFLMENTGELSKTLPGLDEALERFEKLFGDLNSLLAK